MQILHLVVKWDQNGIPDFWNESNSNMSISALRLISKTRKEADKTCHKIKDKTMHAVVVNMKLALSLLLFSPNTSKPTKNLQSFDWFSPDRTDDNTILYIFKNTLAFSLSCFFHRLCFATFLLCSSPLFFFFCNYGENPALTAHLLDCISDHNRHLGR